MPQFIKAQTITLYFFMNYIFLVCNPWEINSLNKMWHCITGKKEDSYFFFFPFLISGRMKLVFLIHSTVANKSNKGDCCCCTWDAFKRFCFTGFTHVSLNSVFVTHFESDLCSWFFFLSPLSVSANYWVKQKFITSDEQDE